MCEETCKRCGGSPVVISNGLCVDCLANDWGKIVDESPMISPDSLREEKPVRQ